MLKVFALILLTCGVVLGQNSNSSTTTERPQRQHEPTQTRTRSHAEPAQRRPQHTPRSAGSKACSPHSTRCSTASGTRASRGDECLLEQSALSLFNYNGSVTKAGNRSEESRELVSRDQRREARRARRVSDDAGTTGAIVTCQWTQSQTTKALRKLRRADDARVQTRSARVESDSPALVA
jgi:hypothetical protein